MTMYPELRHYCDQLVNRFETIPPDRLALLAPICSYLLKKKEHDEPARLVYICTHNSRRSHFGQVWAHVAAEYFNLPWITAYSGGTEATAVHPNTLAALERAGLHIALVQPGENPVYEIRSGEKSTPALCFSKRFDDPSNPSSGFAAIMTCGEADEGCPYVPGSEIRSATTYEDPKHFDGTPQEKEKYDERCLIIATEIFYVFSQVSK